MFQKTRIRDFEKLIVFLNQLHDVLREMYQNGRRPTLRPMPYSVRSLVRRSSRTSGKVRLTSTSSLRRECA
jgi:hypothetical protein